MFLNLKDILDGLFLLKVFFVDVNVLSSGNCTTLLSKKAFKKPSKRVRERERKVKLGIT